MKKLAKNPYKEILAISAGFLILSLIAKKPVLKEVLLYIGIVVPVLSLLSSFLAEKIVWGWYKLAHAIGYINSRILLGFIFFVLLTPIAALYRLKKGDTLRLKRSGESYFTVRNHPYVKGDLEKLW